MIYYVKCLKNQRPGRYNSTVGWFVTVTVPNTDFLTFDFFGLDLFPITTLTQQAIMEKILNEQEAEAYLQSFQETTSPSIIDEPTGEMYTIKKNEEIIRLADKNLIERLKYSDGSLKLSDIVSAKESAFRQNTKLLGLDTDDKQLIPANITINIVNN